MNYYTAGKIFKVLGWIGLIATIICFLIAIILSGGSIIRNIWGETAIVFIPFGISILYLIIGKAIQKHKDWARIVGIILAILQSFAFPIGTLIGGYILWCLIKGWNVK